jgi:hypothetical protein
MEATLLHELAMIAATRDPDALALTHGNRSINYGTFAQSVADVSASLRTLDWRVAGASRCTSTSASRR